MHRMAGSRHHARAGDRCVWGVVMAVMAKAATTRSVWQVRVCTSAVCLCARAVPVQDCVTVRACLECMSHVCPCARCLVHVVRQVHHAHHAHRDLVMRLP
eukprot:9616593-Alexandrium_andersonii.AAC.1